MKARTLTRILGVILPAALIFTAPVLAHDSYDGGGHVDHDYSHGGHVDHDYRNGGHVDHDYSYGGHVDHNYSYGGYGNRGYAPYHGDGYSYGYGHPSGAFGYWGKDARHHARGHYHHHWF